MAASSGRPVAMAVLGTVFIGVLAGVALGAQASWNASCDSGELCNYRYIDFKVPLAATSGSDSDYTNDKYPNTQVVMNDEVRSIKNLFGQKDVVWFEHIKYNGNRSGWSVCLSAGWVWSDMGAKKAQASSHLVATGDTC